MAARKHRLKHLLELAAAGAPARASLAAELCEILVEWPRDYAHEAKKQFEALLGKTLAELEPSARTAIAARFLLRADAPETLHRYTMFSAGSESAGKAACDASLPARTALLNAARSGEAALRDALSTTLGFPPEIAADVLADPSGRALAIACKGSHAGRAVFSALTLLTRDQAGPGDTYLRLAAYEAIAEDTAERLCASWRSDPRAVPQAAE